MLWHSARVYLIVRIFVLLDVDDCQLVLIDYQARLMPAMAESASVLANAMRLARFAKAVGVPAWGTEQVPDKLGTLPAEMHQLCQRVISKRHFSACADGLLDLLRPPATRSRSMPSGNARSLPKHLQKAVPPQLPERNTVVLAGCEAHVCLLQTALDLLEDEFDVWVVTDACSSRTERNRDAAFDRLAANGAELVTTEMVAFEWVRTCDHPQFKAMQDLIT